MSYRMKNKAPSTLYTQIVVLPAQSPTEKLKQLRLNSWL